MGLLFVREDFREKGIARILEQSMINTLRDAGKKVFSQIETTNEVSMIVHQKLGYITSTEVSYWIY